MLAHYAYPSFEYIDCKFIDVCTANFAGNYFDIKIVGNAIGEQAQYQFKYGYSEYNVDELPSDIHRGQFKFDVISDTEVSGYFTISTLLFQRT